jgi:acyl-CoA thioesterase-1
MKIYGQLCVLLLAALCAQSTAAATHDSSRMKTILVLGDSLSDGFGLSRAEAYPALLVERLRAAGLNFEVINASQSGGTSAGGLRRLPPHLKRRVDIFILELGLNDAFQGIPIPEIRDNLEAILDQVKASNPKVRVVIAGMQVPNYAADDYVSEFSKMYAELAAKSHAALVPALLAGVTGDPSLTLPDGIHPNAAGQKILAENVWRVLEPVARDTSDGATARVR